MSGTVKALVLEKAIEMWANPSARYKGYVDDEAQRYCAMGVVHEAYWKLTGRTDWSLEDSAALILGKSRATRKHAGNIAVINDMLGRPGRAYLYWRMKRALKKAKA